MFKLRRVYDSFDKADGYRVLVDRLWPRGLSKEKAKVDLWMKEIAPSTELRQWFHHDPTKWSVFEVKYKDELKSKKDLLEKLQDLEKKHSTVTLLYGAKDSEYNQAVVLESLLSK